MNKCVVCGEDFEPPKRNKNKKTCSDECYRKHMKKLTPQGFLDNSFKKGHKTFNKGRAQKEWMSKEGMEKVSKTHIQNQDCKSILSYIEGKYLPHNAYKKGTVKRRKHIHRTGKNKGKVEYEYYINIDWKGNRKPNNLYKRFIWEYFHQQDIPKGYVVHCMDGDPDNLDISNLELITRGQLAILNRGGKLK